ncbi:MAG TPA: 16S rRNA (cytosine(1402)-N(4))-methyltransferase [Prevotellaceae bacterium]|nr:16S rRNA (cytosine(1402)-N(4))-methyltransferase [Prevotellaceae bacterium]
MSESCYHIPVMLQPCLEGLNINPDGTYVDVTFGGGGHSKAILERLSANGHLYAFDQDADAEQNIPADDRFTFVRSNFRYLRNWLRYYGAIPVDGILADLGVSSHHFDTMERGFSIREDGPLDMRMNQQATRTAAEIVNGYDAGQLAEIFDWYGELHNAHAIANAIIRDRQANGEIRTTAQLHKAVSKQLNPAREKKDLAKVFQALRIEVNDELVVLKEMLSAAIEVLKPGGRLVVMSYHSLEDRLVKNFMRSGNAKGLIEKDFYGNPISVLRQLKGYPISPSEQEQEQNPRSRSAKLRVAEKTKEQ